jgi:hypothetical protein
MICLKLSEDRAHLSPPDPGAGLRPGHQVGFLFSGGLDCCPSTLISARWTLGPRAPSGGHIGTKEGGPSCHFNGLEVKGT